MSLMQYDIELLYHKLVTVRASDTWKHIMDEKKYNCKTRPSDSGKHSDIFVGRKLYRNTNSSILDDGIAVKTQFIRDSEDPNDKCYRELIIFKILNQMKNFCPNFIELKDWFKSIGDHEEDSDDSEEDDGEYMSLVLERADENLLKHTSQRTIPLTDYKSFLFQTLFALHSAQQLCEFVHNDLHLKNIMLKKVPDDVALICFHYEGECYYMSNYLIKITDFGHARCTLSKGKVLYDHKNHSKGCFNPYTDVIQLAQEFSKIRIDWTKVKNVEEEKNNLRKLRIDMRKGKATPGVLLKYDFFKSMNRFLIERGGRVLHYGLKEEAPNVLLNKENVDPVLSKVTNIIPAQRSSTLLMRSRVREALQTRSNEKKRKRETRVVRRAPRVVKRVKKRRTN